MWGISAAAVISGYFSVNQKSQLLNFRWGYKGDYERMWEEEGKLKLQLDRMIASAISWGLGWSHSLSAPPHSQCWVVKDTNVGRLRFFPGQTDPTASPVHLYTSFPGVFISLIYSKLWPSRNFCCIFLSPNTSWCKCRESDGRPPSWHTFIRALLGCFVAVNLRALICKMEIMLLCPHCKGEESIFSKKNTCDYTLET